jgi:Tol biopolymer transport system component
LRQNKGGGPRAGRGWAPGTRSARIKGHLAARADSPSAGADALVKPLASGVLEGDTGPVESRALLGWPAMFSLLRSARSLVLAATATAAVCVALPAQADATFPGQDGRIAYAKHELFRGEGGSDEPPGLDSLPSLFTLNPDGSAPRRLARFAEEPAFSPGGSFIAFQDYLDRVFIRPTAGGRRRILKRGLGIDVQADPAWSPSGRNLIFALERFEPRTDLYLHRVRRDGTGMHRLRRGIEPDWSVRNRVVFEAGGRIATMAPGGGQLRRLRAGGQPSWSPDGRWIVFIRSLPRERSGVAIMRADGSRLRTLTRGPWSASPVWSPQGEHIAYIHRNRKKAREKIVVMRTNGTGRRSILTVWV